MSGRRRSGRNGWSVDGLEAFAGDIGKQPVLRDVRLGVFELLGEQNGGLASCETRGVS